MKEQYVLTIDPVAMERCFLVADILSEDYNRDYTEYGFCGLAAQQKPLHVLATPLLHGQRVTAGSVYQAGQDVFRLREEMNILSKRMGQALVPIAFVHRHPGGCGMSFTDVEFLTGPFIDQVSTVVRLHETRVIQPGEFDCGCREMKRLNRQGPGEGTLGKPMRIEYGICFSLIVNREREFSIDAACKYWCVFCHKPLVSLVPAELCISPKRQLTKKERRKLKRQLVVEIEAKLRFESILADTDW